MRRRRRPARHGLLRALALGAALAAVAVGAAAFNFDVAPPQLAFFVLLHVPKTGGTTLRFTMENQAGCCAANKALWNSTGCGGIGQVVPWCQAPAPSVFSCISECVTRPARSEPSAQAAFPIPAPDIRSRDRGCTCDHVRKRLVHTSSAFRVATWRTDPAAARASLAFRPCTCGAAHAQALPGVHRYMTDIGAILRSIAAPTASPGELATAVVGWLRARGGRVFSEVHLPTNLLAPLKRLRAATQSAEWRAAGADLFVLTLLREPDHFLRSNLHDSFHHSVFQRVFQAKFGVQTRYEQPGRVTVASQLANPCDNLSSSVIGPRAFYPEEHCSVQSPPSRPNPQAWHAQIAIKWQTAPVDGHVPVGHRFRSRRARRT